MVPGWFYDFSWLQIVFYGSGWFFMVSCGFLWCSKFPGWVSIVPSFLWFRVGFMISHDYRLFFVVRVGIHGFSSFQVGFYGYS